MTSKEKVFDFLSFLQRNSGSICTKNAVYTYSELLQAFLDTFEAYADSQIQKNLQERDSFNDWDETLISGKADW